MAATDNALTLAASCRSFATRWGQALIADVTYESRLESVPIRTARSPPHRGAEQHCQLAARLSSGQIVFRSLLEWNFTWEHAMCATICKTFCVRAPH
eukprot:4551164-Amphidinium_carterae.1